MESYGVKGEYGGALLLSKSLWLCHFIPFISGDIALFLLLFFLVTTLVPIGWTFFIRRNRYRYPQFSNVYI